LKRKVSEADWDRQQQLAVVRTMRLRYAEFLFNPCELCGNWCVSNLDVPIKAHPLCYYDPKYQKALAAAPDKNQAEFALIA
jgi:hypothetical protein